MTASFLKNLIFRFWNNFTKHINFPADTERKLNVHKTFRRRLGRLLNVLCAFNFSSKSKGFKLFFTILNLKPIPAKAYALQSCYVTQQEKLLQEKFKLVSKTVQAMKNTFRKLGKLEISENRIQDPKICVA